MELYEIGSRRLSSEDLDVVGEDLSKFVADCLKKDGRFDQIDKPNSNGYLTRAELDDFIKTNTAGKTQKSKEAAEADAILKSMEPLADLHWDPVLFGPQVSRKDLEELPKQIKSALEKVRQAEELAATVQKHFYKIKECWHQKGQDFDEISDTQIRRYLKTAQLTAQEREHINNIQNTSLWRAWRVRYDDVGRYPHQVRRDHESILETGMNLWRDLPEKSYVPERPPVSLLGIGLGIFADSLRAHDNSTPAEQLERASQLLDPSINPRYVPRALDNLRDAAAVDSLIAQTPRFQKVAAMAGGPYDPSFMDSMKRSGVDVQIQQQFNLYRKNGLDKDDVEVRGVRKK